MSFTSGSTLAAVSKQLGVYDIGRQLAQSAAGLGSVTLFSNYLATLAVQLGLFGIILSQVRSKGQQVFDYFYSLIFVTVHVTGGALTWIESYTARDAYVQSQLKHYCMSANDVSTTSVTHPDRNGKRSAQATWVQDGVAYKNVPLQNQQVVVKHAGRKIWLVRVHEKLDGGMGGHSPLAQYFRLTVWAWDRETIGEFISAAHKSYHEKGTSEIHVFTHSNEVLSSNAQLRWTGPIVQKSRPWSSVVLPEGVKENLLKDISSFVSEEERDWYASHGIPHRRGYLLHGPPGTGKTTLVKALAGKLGMDLYNITPAEPGMDNQKLSKYFRACARRSILLIEDIDCVMASNRAMSPEDHPTQRATGGGSGSKKKSKKADERHEPKSLYSASQVTLSGLLNAIDGIASQASRLPPGCHLPSSKPWGQRADKVVQEDSILIASTNYPDKLDSALQRPGRFDVHIEFDYATGHQAADVFKHFYTSRPASQADANDCVNEKGIAALVGFDTEGDLQQAADKFATMIDPDHHHGQEGQEQQDTHDDTGERPNGDGPAHEPDIASENKKTAKVQVTVAAIQAYLLPHKKDPHAALENAPAWVESCRQGGADNDHNLNTLIPDYARNGHIWPPAHAPTRRDTWPDLFDELDAETGAGIHQVFNELARHGIFQ